jgi:hypothetical protein
MTPQPQASSSGYDPKPAHFDTVAKFIALYFRKYISEGMEEDAARLRALQHLKQEAHVLVEPY